MINGLKVTQIPLVKSHLQSHRKKLHSIANKKFSFAQVIPQQEQDSYTKHKQSRSHYSQSLSQSRQKIVSGMSPDEQFRYTKTKENHLKSVSYHKFKKESEIQHENSLIYEKLLQIKKRKDINNPSPVNMVQHHQNNESLSKPTERLFRKPQKKMAKDFVYRKKQFMAIQSTNMQIGKRIMNQTGYYDHQKDQEHFNKTRQILNRLNKFNIMQRLMGQTKRSKTMPSKLPRLKTEFTESIVSQSIKKIGNEQMLVEEEVGV